MYTFVILYSWCFEVLLLRSYWVNAVFLVVHVVIIPLLLLPALYTLHLLHCEGATNELLGPD